MGIQTQRKKARSELDIKQKKSILRKYLGFSPAWFDLRKKEILNDNIDISQWQNNMNYMMYRHGSKDSREERAFDWWASNLEDFGTDKTNIVQYLEENVTPALKYGAGAALPSKLHWYQDRNWFLAAYPDVFEYFYPQPNELAADFDAEMKRVEEHVKAIAQIHERMEQYVTTGKGNHTIQLARMKNFYKNELDKNFLLSL